MTRSTCRGVSLGKFPLDTRRSDMTPWQKLGQFLFFGGGASVEGTYPIQNIKILKLGA